MVKVAIVCEGKTDREFFETLITHLELDLKRASFYPFNGKNFIFDAQNKKHEELKQLISTDQIRKVLFVVDADDLSADSSHGGFDNTEENLSAVINKLGFGNVAVTYIMCDPLSKTGYLESLILSTISNSQRNCIESFLKCSQFQSKEHDKAIHKQIYKLAYPNAPYDFSHSHFTELKAILTNLFRE